MELKAEESESTRVGQNSTQNPHPLHRSMVINTEPFAIPCKNLHADDHDAPVGNPAFGREGEVSKAVVEAAREKFA